MYQLDHVVHYLERPEAETLKLKNHQLNVRNGGSHENRPTYNSLLHFGLSYVEFLSISNKELLEALPHGESSMIQSIINRGYQEGFARFILRTTDIYAVKEKLEKKGLVTEGPVVLQRKDQNGELISWKLLFLKDPEGGLDLPYIIEWDEKDAARVQRLVRSGLLADTDNHSEKISQLNIVAKNPTELAAKWAYYFDVAYDEAKASVVSFSDFQIVFYSIENVSETESNRLHNEQGIFEVIIDGIERDTLEFANGLYTFNK
ncbi:VOC family protein [Sporosarcina siberiensis]|uniref:VOC family protein n=1 Tax=Sporosarcina siberiensis TaxID=1365606 RepID=A0ABW4SLF5_9BACL